MPFKYDWDEAGEISSIEVNNIEGWKDLTIEYTYVLFNLGTIDIYWRIKGTDHTFVAKDSDFFKFTSPREYFKSSLSQFKSELLEWARDINNGEGAPWMGEYILMFKDYVL